MAPRKIPEPLLLRVMDGGSQASGENVRVLRELNLLEYDTRILPTLALLMVLRIINADDHDR